MQPVYQRTLGDSVLLTIYVFSSITRMIWQVFIHITWFWKARAYVDHKHAILYSRRLIKAFCTVTLGHIWTTIGYFCFVLFFVLLCLSVCLFFVCCLFVCFVFVLFCICSPHRNRQVSQTFIISSRWLMKYVKLNKMTQWPKTIWKIWAFSFN